MSIKATSAVAVSATGYLGPASFANELEYQYSNDNESYSLLLKENATQIIDSLGGLHHILMLSLTHSQRSLSEDQLANLQCMLLKHEQNTIDDADIMDNIRRFNQKKHDLITNVVFELNESNDIFHRLLPAHTADVIVSTVFKNKFIILTLSMIATCYTLSKIFINVPVMGTAFFGGYLLWIVFICSCYVCCCHIYLMVEIMKTFDFIFKFYSIILILISYPPLIKKTGAETALIWYCTDFAFLVGLYFVCVIDAFPITQKHKVMIVAFYVLILSYFGVNTYFAWDDVLWDPFKGKFGDTMTQISFKSIYLGGIVNFTVLSVYISVIPIIKEKLMEKYSVCKLDKDLIHSTSITYRPYFKWIRSETDDDEDNKVESDNIETVNTAAT